MKILLLISILLCFSGIWTYARGNCIKIAHRTARILQSRGYETRIVRGWFKGKPHRWVEYKQGDKWIVRDNAIWYVGKGFTRAEIGDYIFREYYKS